MLAGEKAGLSLQRASASLMLQMKCQSDVASVGAK
jgi:hypothetical protein